MSEEHAQRLPLTLLGLALTGVGGAFSYYIITLEVPGGLATWSLTVLGYGLWLWPIRGLVSRARGDQGQAGAPVGE